MSAVSPLSVIHCSSFWSRPSSTAHTASVRGISTPAARARAATAGADPLADPATLGDEQHGERHARRRATGRTQTVGQPGFQHQHRCRSRRQSRHRGCVRARQAHSQIRDAGEPRHRRAHGAARGSGAVRHCDTPLHAARRQRRRGAPETGNRDGPQSRSLGHSRAVVRRGRQFRHAQSRLCRVRPRRMGVPPSQAAGEIHGDAVRGFPQRLPGP